MRSDHRPQVLAVEPEVAGAEGAAAFGGVQGSGEPDEEPPYEVRQPARQVATRTGGDGAQGGDRAMRGQQRFGSANGLGTSAT
ncbi:hypothetical protein ABZ912_46755 [Nonomuraea angiospora]|uniref:hypothetical protein n=1 Tax=Nonomuraea angiospora TaxID=46172 RepID=UPI0033D68BAF